jgi:hypothetical protein
MRGCRMRRGYGLFAMGYDLKKWGIRCGMTMVYGIWNQWWWGRSKLKNAVSVISRWGWCEGMQNDVNGIMHISYKRFHGPIPLPGFLVDDAVDNVDGLLIIDARDLTLF